MSVDDLIADLGALFERMEQSDYLGESVSVAAHQRQSAAAAQHWGAPDSLVVAALLHDVGHFIEADGAGDFAEGRDDHHEMTGADWLAVRFPTSVSEPVRLHVAAKRYLCATDPTYYDALSAASKYTLELQGGPMDGAAQVDFEALAFHADAVFVRRCDDHGKDAEVRAPAFDAFIPLLRTVAS